MNKALIWGVAAILILWGIWAFSGKKDYSGELSIISPLMGDVWEQGKTYKIEWTGGGEIISVYLINRSLESVGASVSISDRIQNIRNEGFYEYNVPADLRGEHKIAIHSNGKSVESGYFDIKQPPVVYDNSQHGFSVKLPDDWRGYSIFENEWSNFINSTMEINEKGLLIEIRHPQWTEKIPRQNIPIMIFTLEQWGRVLKGNLVVGAAPIPPTELGKNSKYVFAIPARYNYAFLAGWEEVDEIIKDKSRWKFF